MLLRNFKCLIPVIVFLTFANTPALAKIIHVPADSTTIQGGINGASDGDTILVARGHYHERINFYGKAILVASDFIFDNDTTTIDSTIIDADSSVLGVADTGSVVVFVSGEDSTSVIQGFTLQNGIGTVISIFTGVDKRLGGGACCVHASPTIINNVITKNKTIYHESRPGTGGGIYCYYSSPIIKNNAITENSGHGGGGVFCWDSDPIVSNNVIAGNSSGVYGGGMQCEFSSPIISDNVISGNHGNNGGGGIECGRWCSPVVSNNTIIQNSSNGCGGGIEFCWECGGFITDNIITDNSAKIGAGICCNESSPSITNNTIARNLGGGLYCFYYSFAAIANNVITNNLDGEGIYSDDGSSLTISYNDVCNNKDGNFVNCPAGIGDTNWGTNINGIPSDSFHNIIRDPLFVDSLNDFRLQEGSPCIDAGDNSVAPDSDLDGNQRIVDGNDDDSAVVDMGAYEFQPLVGITEDKLPFSASDFVVLQNYPNPFNPQTTIEYYLPRSTWVNLTIYNVLGRKIKVLVNDFQTKGKKSVTWDGKDQKGRIAASGIYFYRLETTDYVESKKMLLIK